MERIGVPGILKTRRDGYDGKGQWSIDEAANAQGIRIPETGCFYEARLNFECEFSVTLVRGRDGGTGQSLTDAFAAADEALIEALVVRLEGRTEKQKNPHPPGSLARAAWVIGRLGGWSGYSGGGYKPPGPKTMYDGLVKFDAIKQGWGLAPATGAAKNV